LKSNVALLQQPARIGWHHRRLRMNPQAENSSRLKPAPAACFSRLCIVSRMIDHPA
jgi:hypothetical protein